MGPGLRAFGMKRRRARDAFSHGKLSVHGALGCYGQAHLPGELGSLGKLRRLACFRGLPAPTMSLGRQNAPAKFPPRHAGAPSEFLDDDAAPSQNIRILHVPSKALCCIEAPCSVTATMRLPDRTRQITFRHIRERQAHLSNACAAAAGDGFSPMHVQKERCVISEGPFEGSDPRK
jgi:hypothetical protein